MFPPFVFKSIAPDTYSNSPLLLSVRECLEFSALLRQPAHIPRAEKLEYASEVIDLLELGPIADALGPFSLDHRFTQRLNTCLIVGNMDIGGLGVEERKVR